MFWYKKQFFLCYVRLFTEKRVQAGRLWKLFLLYRRYERDYTYKGALLLSIYKTPSAAWSLEISPLLFVRLLLGSVSFSRRTIVYTFSPGISIDQQTRKEREGLLLISSADVEPRRRSFSHPQCCYVRVWRRCCWPSLSPPSRGNDVVDRLISHI